MTHIRTKVEHFKIEFKLFSKNLAKKIVNQNIKTIQIVVKVIQYHRIKKFSNNLNNANKFNIFFMFNLKIK